MAGPALAETRPAPALSPSPRTRGRCTIRAGAGRWSGTGFGFATAGGASCLTRVSGVIAPSAVPDARVRTRRRPAQRPRSVAFRPGKRTHGRSLRAPGLPDDGAAGRHPHAGFGLPRGPAVPPRPWTPGAGQGRGGSPERGQSGEAAARAGGVCRRGSVEHAPAAAFGGRGGCGRGACRLSSASPLRRRVTTRPWMRRLTVGRAAVRLAGAAAAPPGKR